ncbi:MAG TPA: hypothetical protein DHV26_07725 [Cytophagales bacterium]|nr:hypothetical protein [Cytophagales bacterium]
MPIVIDNARFRKLLRAYPLKAITILRKQYGQRLYEFSFRLTQDLTTAEDIVHDTFLQVWEQHRKLSHQHNQSLENYLVRVVRNKSIVAYKQSRHLVFDEKFFRNKLATDPEQAFIRQQLLRVIFDLIETFPPRERQCMELWLQGIQAPEIAIRLDVSVKAIEARITSARKRLRDWAAREG